MTEADKMSCSLNKVIGNLRQRGYRILKYKQNYKYKIKNVCTLRVNVVIEKRENRRKRARREEFFGGGFRW